MFKNFLRFDLSQVAQTKEKTDDSDSNDSMRISNPVFDANVLIICIFN